MNKTTLIVIGCAVVVVLVLFATRPVTLGGPVVNIVTQFVQGLIVGDDQNAACVKVQDTDKGGYSYITYLNGVQSITGGASGAFNIPDACTGK